MTTEELEAKLQEAWNHTEPEMDQKFLNAKFNVYCPNCKKVTEGQLEHDLDIIFACDSCGDDNECTIQIKCKDCDNVIFARDY